MKIKVFVLILALLINVPAANTAMDPELIHASKIFKTQSSDQTKRIFIGIIDVLINFTINERLTQFVRNNAAYFIQAQYPKPQTSYDPAWKKIAEDIKVSSETFKRHSARYKPLDVIIAVGYEQLTELYCGKKSCEDVLSFFQNKTEELYSYAKHFLEAETEELCFLDKFSLDLCVNLLFNQSFKIGTEAETLDLKDCFEIKWEGVILLYNLLATNRHDIYFTATIPNVWYSILFEKMSSIFNKLKPRLHRDQARFEFLDQFIFSFNTGELTIPANGNPTSIIIDHSSHKFVRHSCRQTTTNILFNIPFSAGGEDKLAELRQIFDQLKDCGVFDSSKDNFLLLPQE